MLLFLLLFFLMRKSSSWSRVVYRTALSSSDLANRYFFTLYAPPLEGELTGKGVWDDTESVSLSLDQICGGMSGSGKNRVSIFVLLKFIDALNGSRSVYECGQVGVGVCVFANREGTGHS